MRRATTAAFWTLVLLVTTGTFARAQGKSVVFHMARFEYAGRALECTDTKDPLLKVALGAVSASKQVTVGAFDALRKLVPGSKSNKPDKCKDAVLMEEALTRAVANAAKENFAYQITPDQRVYEVMERDIERSAKTKDTIHLLVNCRLLQERENRYLISFEVTPLHGEIEPETGDYGFELTDVNQVVWRTYHEASRKLQQLCRQTAERALRSH